MKERKTAKESSLTQRIAEIDRSIKDKKERVLAGSLFLWVKGKR